MRPQLSSLGLLLILSAPALSAPPDDAAGIEFFEKKIRPVLVEHCYECHSAEAKKGLKGGLALDSREASRKGGDSGPAVVPGKPDESLLIEAVRYTDEALKMPPEGKLPAETIADLERGWPWGRPTLAARPPLARRPRRGRRSSRAVGSGGACSRRDVRRRPEVKDAGWSAHPVDRFLLAGLERAGLTPAEPADRRTLIRRLSLVLTGLPPTAGGGRRVRRATSPPGAYEALVDRLLASPHFGERWARHWLDVVRFTETHGNEWNYEVHHAWRYRDYLIRAFNDDVPYDQFVREHIAGDLLPEPRWNRGERFNESVIGTAFYRFGEVNHDDCIGLRQIGYDLADNQIDTLTKAFQATTVACARCHDHKLDAVSTKDYYALLGILRSSRLVSHTIDAPEVNAEPIRQTARAEGGDPRGARRGLAARGAARSAATCWRPRPVAQVGPTPPSWPSGSTPAPGTLDGRAPGREGAAGRPALALAVARVRGPAGVRGGMAEAGRAVCEGGPRAGGVQRERVRHLRRLPLGRARRLAGGGQGLRDGAGRSGDFALAPRGRGARAGRPPRRLLHARALGQAQRHACARPSCPAGKKHISFQVMGSAAARCGWSRTTASSTTGTTRP